MIQISKRDLKYFISLTGYIDINALFEAGYIDKKAVRNYLIKEEFYKLLQEMKEREAVEKIGNDYKLSVHMVRKIVSDRA